MANTFIDTARILVRSGAGGNGAGKQCTGKNGAPLIIRVPRGTVVRDAETREIIQDMSERLG